MTWITEGATDGVFECIETLEGEKVDCDDLRDAFVEYIGEVGGKIDRLEIELSDLDDDIEALIPDTFATILHELEGRILEGAEVYSWLCQVIERLADPSLTNPVKRLKVIG